MGRLLIMGAGGHGKVLAEAAFAMNHFSEILFLDDFFSKNENCIGFSVVGSFNDMRRLFQEGDSLAVAIGDNRKRLSLLAEAKELGYALPVIIHPFSWLSPSVSIAEGSVVLAGAVLNSSVKIGRGCIVNTSATVDHDCVLADGVHLSPGSHLSGQVSIGECSWICVGAAIGNQISIGKNCVLAAGAALVSDMPDDAFFAGVPAQAKQRK